MMLGGFAAGPFHLGNRVRFSGRPKAVNQSASWPEVPARQKVTEMSAPDHHRRFERRSMTSA